MKLLTALVVLLMFGLASCGDPQRVLQSGTVGANGEVGQVLLRNIHMTPPGGDGYEPGDDAVVQLSIFNQARETDTLVDVRSDAAKDIVMRWDEQCDGQAEQVERLPLLADGGVARLSGAMGAYHFEFVDLTRKLWAGNDVAVTFEFERAGSVTLDVPIEVETDATGLRHPENCPASSEAPSRITPATVKGEVR